MGCMNSKHEVTNSPSTEVAQNQQTQRFSDISQVTESKTSDVKNEKGEKNEKKGKQSSSKYETKTQDKDNQENKKLSEGAVGNPTYGVSMNNQGRTSGSDKEQKLLTVPPNYVPNQGAHSNEGTDDRQKADTDRRNKDILEAEIKSLEKKMKRNREESAAKDEEIKKIKHDLEAARNQLEVTEQNQAEKDKENKQIKQDLKDTRSQLEATNEQNQKLKTKLDELKERKPDKQNDTDETKRSREEKGKRHSNNVAIELLKNQNDSIHNELRVREKEIQQLKQEKDDLYLRLSALAGRKLTDNNPNIADLSDMNRPTKIAENYSQLYDNEWTDAFQELESLQEYKDKDERTIIKVLFDTITIAYQVALVKATSELQKIKEAIHDIGGVEDETKDLVKQLKDRRKKDRVSPDSDLKEKYQSKVKKQFPHIPCDKLESAEWNRYRDACLNIAWLMAIQDPPVYLECGDKSCKSGDKHDRSRYREYTKSGDMVDFPVWPALYIQQGGSMLGKGVAQCKTSFSTSVQIRKTDGKANTKQTNNSLSKSFHGTPSAEISAMSNPSCSTAF